MVNGYVRASKEIVPSVRIAMALELSRNYNLSEERIAGILGVTQAAVSKYLNGSYSDKIRDLIKNFDESEIKKFSAKIAAGEKDEVNKYICSLCASLNQFGCAFSSLNKIRV
jgi:predicted transcriptional regulator